MAQQANQAPDKKWVLAEDSAASGSGVNYDKYAHPIAMPGPVLSSKTGKQYTPQLGDLGKKKPAGRGGAMGGAVKRQGSQGMGRGSGGLDLMVQSQPQQLQ